MRLLNVNVDGSFSLTTFIGKQIPSYAILSHTWEANNQEVTFQDLEKGIGNSKSGYRKIQFCGAQAQKDDLKYFWVDSCCIDKSNNAELHEAINSMFHWYQNAAKCYVYLSDVLAVECTQPQWQSTFMRSRWFTRGWTLQELLAPQSVEFFSHDGERLGNKDSLEQQIHEATGIAIQALQGMPLSQFSVDERMSWTMKRETTIEEDQIYCLLGIFDVYLPLIYGEGKRHAFRRLQDEIGRRSSLNTQEMRPENANRKQRVDAFLQLLYDNACSYEDSKNRNRERVTGTCDWFTNHDLFKKWNMPTDSQLKPSIHLFVTADPGCGKSVLSRYLIDHILSQHARMVCYFFFKDDFEDQKNSLQALCTILHQLLSRNRHILSDAMLEKHGALGKRFVESFANLWSIFMEAASYQETVCVIDALDECRELDRNQLIEAVTTVDQGSKELKFLVTSRPYEHIRRQFHRRLGSRMSSIHLQGDCGPTADAIVQEIQLVVNSRIEEAADLFCLESDERKLLRKQLESVPNRTYLWVTLVFDGLIDSILGIDQSDILRLTQTLPQSVNDAYEKILNQNPKLEKLRRRALYIILGAKRPMSLTEMSVALAFKDLDNQSSCTFSADKIIPMNRMRAHIRDLCGLFITIVDDKVYLLHQTAREFLIRNTAEDVTGARTVCSFSQSSQREWRHSINLEDSNSVLTKICVSYLHLDIAKEDSALLEYSAIYWPDHYHQSRGTCQELVAKMAKHKEIPAAGSPLCLASALGLDRAVEMFLREQITPSFEIGDVESKDTEYGRTPLLWAARNEHEVVVKALLEAGADIESKDKYGQTPLSCAAENGHGAVVKALLDAGADIESKDTEYGQTPLLLATMSEYEAVVKALLDAGADIESKDTEYGRTPLSWAAKNGHEAVVKVLLEAGADIESKDKYSQTPLSCAAENGHEAVVKALLEAGADIKSKDKYGQTPLSWAARNGHEAVFKTLQSSSL